MDLLSRLSGYTTNHNAYNNPIPILPTPKTLHDKKDTTLIQMAMKAFLKQRIYGRFRNFQIMNIHNKNHLDQKQKSLTQRSRNWSKLKNIKGGPIMQMRQKQSKNNSQFSQNKEGYKDSDKKQKVQQNEYHESERIIKQKGHKINQYQNKFIKIKENTLKNNNSMSLPSKFKRTQQIREIRKSLDCRQISNQKKVNKQEISGYPEISFISAIDIQQEQEQRYNLRQQSIKLPQIKNKRLKVNDKEKMPKNPKLKVKKNNSLSYVIQKHFWQFISSSKLSISIKIKKQRKKKSQENQPIFNDADIIQSVSNTSQVSQYKKNNEEIGLNNQLTNEFSKQKFQQFMRNQIVTIPNFAIHILNFLQILNKLEDKMIKQMFQLQFSKAQMILERVWCIAIFRYLDVNLDGVIDSSDLFKIYNYIDKLKQKVQEARVKESQIDERNGCRSSRYENDCKNRKSQKKKEQEEQKQINNKLNPEKEGRTKDGKERKSKVGENDEILSGQLREESGLLRWLMQRNSENIKQFKGQIQKLVNKLVQKQKNQTALDLLAESSSKPTQSTQNQLLSHPQTLYLQQALLKNKQLKLSDLSLIFNQSDTQNSSHQKKVIDINYKSLNIKLSSTYAQTFAATDHNQLTRSIRQNLQNLKDYLKNSNHQKQHQHTQLEKKCFPTLKYSQFYQQKLYLPFKSLFFTLLHLKPTLHQ